VEGVTELLLEYRSEARGLVDLKGQRVRLVVNQVEFSGSEQWSRAVVLRTMGGQLLVASIHGAIDEYFAEGLPELRAQISGERGTPVTRQCSGANGSITSVPASLQLRSLNETKVFAGCTRGGLAIGCVAYLVATGRVEEITKMEIKQLPCAIDPPLEFEVARTGILER